MTDTLFDATLHLARQLGEVREYKAQSGTATTLVDTVLLTQKVGAFNEGTVWITDSGTLTAPEGEFAIVTAFGTGQLTFTTLSATVGADYRYAVANANYPLDSLVGAINTVLRKTMVPTWNATALDAADNQTEYDLPTAIPRGNLRAVYYQTQTGDANDNHWIKIHNWRVQPGATGSADTLILPQLSSSHDIALLYVAPHTALYEATAQLNEVINLDGLVAHAKVVAIQNYMIRGQKDQYLPGLYNAALDEASRKNVTYYTEKQPIKFNYISDKRGTSYTGVVGKVRI